MIEKIYPFLRNQITLLFIFILVFFINCNSPMVKKDQIEYLNKKYSGQYITTKTLDVGNNDILPKGSRVKLYFKSHSESIIAYAYRANQPREMVIGKNILFLFETDFPEEEFQMKVFEERLNEIIKSADAKPEEKKTK